MVINIPTNDKAEQINITVLSPYALAAGSNIVAPRNAPSFPLAAETPFKVYRQEGENVMEGNMKVVVFGP